MTMRERKSMLPFFITLLLCFGALIVFIFGPDPNKVIGGFKYIAISMAFAPLRYAFIAAAFSVLFVCGYILNLEVSRKFDAARNLVKAYAPAFDLDSIGSIRGIMLTNEYLNNPLPILPLEYNNTNSSDTQRIKGLRALYLQCFHALPKVFTEYESIAGNPLALHKISQLWLVRSGGPYSILFVSHDTTLPDGKVTVITVNILQIQQFRENISTKEISDDNIKYVIGLLDKGMNSTNFGNSAGGFGPDVNDRNWAFFLIPNPVKNFDYRQLIVDVLNLSWLFSKSA